MRYITLDDEQQASVVRSQLQAIESQHLQASTSLEAGLDGYTEEAVARLAAGIESLQAKVNDLEGKVKK